MDRDRQARIAQFLKIIFPDGLPELGLDDLERLETILENSRRKVLERQKEAKPEEEKGRLDEREAECRDMSQMQKPSEVPDPKVDAAAAADAVPRVEEDPPMETAPGLD